MTTCLFIGSFRTTKEGRGGGQNRQCAEICRLQPGPDWRWLPFDVTDESTSKLGVFARLLRGLGRLRRLHGVVRSQRVDAALVFTSCYTFSLIEKGLMGLLLKAMGVRVAYSYRSQLQPVSSAGIRFGLWLCRLAGDWHLAQGRNAAAALRALSLPDNRIRVLPNLVDHAVWQPVWEARLARASRADGSPLSMVFAGWLEPIKGVDVLLTALAQLSRQAVPWRLVVCGAGSLESSLRVFAIEKGIDGHIDWRGWQDRAALSRHFVEADVLVLPSRSEGFPNVILEAFSAGLPVVASAVGGVSELVDDGIDGLLCRPDDASGLADGLLSLSQGRPRLQQMGQAARQKVAAGYGDKISAEVLGTVLTKPRPPVA